MAEAVGLRIGVISLADLCSSCLELADAVLLAQNVSCGFEVTFTKFSSLKTRLNVWSSSLNVLQSGHENTQLRAHWGQESELICGSLMSIKTLLKEAAALEPKHSLQKESAGLSITSTVKERISADPCAAGKALNGAVKQKVEYVPIRRNTSREIRDKKALDDLVSQLTFHIYTLEVLAQKLQVSGDRLFAPALEASTTTRTALEMLKAATDESDSGDPYPETGIGRAAARIDGHLYFGNEIREHARVLYGDTGHFEAIGARHIYSGNKIFGDAKVICGNVSAEAVREFFAA